MQIRKTQSHTEMRDTDNIETLAVNGYYPFGFMIVRQVYGDARYFGTDGSNAEAGLMLKEQTSYYPFGMQIATLSYSREDYTFGMQGMIRDDEMKGAGNVLGTHFRQNDSRTGRWWGRDPKAASFPWSSSYVSMGNNPISRIDPRGDDDFDVNSIGEIVNTIENKKSDNIYIIDDKGNRVEDKSITFDYGTIRKVENPKIKYTMDGKIHDERMGLIHVDGDEKATQLFEFLANPNNTSVEWGLSRVGVANSNHNIIGTNKSHRFNMVSVYLTKIGDTVKEDIHNHPSGYSYPSGLYNPKQPGDIRTAKFLISKNPNIVLKIYTHPKKYIEYSDKGVNPNNIKGIIIKEKKNNGK